MPISTPTTSAIGMKGLDLIASSLRLINVLASGETPSADEANDALMILNQMIDEWNADRLMVFTVANQIFSLTTLKQAYTMGLDPNADFKVPRPARIENAGIIVLNNPAQPLELPMQMLTTEQWLTIPIKNITSTIPLQLYDDGGFPLRSLNLWPIPSAPVNLSLYFWQALSAFPDLVTQMSFPPAYLKALRYALAVDLAPEFGAQVPQVVAVQAIDAIAKIKSINAPIVDLRCDPALVSPERKIYDWRSDSGGKSGY